MICTRTTDEGTSVSAASQALLIRCELDGCALPRPVRPREAPGRWSLSLVQATAPARLSECNPRMPSTTCLACSSPSRLSHTEGPQPSCPPRAVASIPRIAPAWSCSTPPTAEKHRCGSSRSTYHRSNEPTLQKEDRRERRRGGVS